METASCWVRWKKPLIVWNFSLSDGKTVVIGAWESWLDQALLTYSYDNGWVADTTETAELTASDGETE